MAWETRNKFTKQAKRLLQTNNVNKIRNNKNGTNALAAAAGIRMPKWDLLHMNVSSGVGEGVRDSHL